jgi:hypothetical protein
MYEPKLQINIFQNFNNYFILKFNLYNFIDG